MERRTFLLLVSAAGGRADEFWESRTYPNWTGEEVDRLLTNSPWAKPMRVSFLLENRPGQRVMSFSDVGLPPGIGLPGGVPGWPGGVGFPRGRTGSPGPQTGGASARAEAYLTVRWSSALPVRQALLLDRSRRELALSGDAPAALELEQPDYLIDVFGLPAQTVSGGTKELATSLAATASLVRKGRRPVSAESVEIPPYGNHLSLHFRFPRTDPILLEDRQVEFFAAGGPFEFRKAFKLPPMVYGGRLAL